MKKAFLFAAVVIAAVAGTVCYNHEKEEELSDLAIANIKALANNGGNLETDVDMELRIVPCYTDPGNECTYCVRDYPSCYKYSYCGGF